MKKFKIIIFPLGNYCPRSYRHCTEVNFLSSDHHISFLNECGKRINSNCNFIIEEE